jgi:hypothetical protein
MENTEKNIQKTLDNLVNQLKELESTCSESEFDEYLEKEVAPKLTKEEQLWGTSVFRKLDIAVSLYKPECEQMNASIMGAMFVMNNDSIQWFLSHVYELNKAIEVLEGSKRMDYQELEHLTEHLDNNKRYLQKCLNGELGERIQRFENDTKRLQEA